jgi:prevent-host-death family protein
MATVGVRELRQRASELLRRVEAGETIEVTDRGRPVAVLAPLPDRSPIERLSASGDQARNRRRACWHASDAMSANKATYLDSSALVKLAVREPESAALRRYLRRRRPLIASALARTEVARALLSLGPEAVRRGHDVLARVGLVRINDRVLDGAGAMLPVELRSLDAIHLATAQQLGADLARIVTYDDRMAAAANHLGLTVARPA